MVEVCTVVLATQLEEGHKLRNFDGVLQIKSQNLFHKSAVSALSLTLLLLEVHGCHVIFNPTPRLEFASRGANNPRVPARDGDFRKTNELPEQIHN